MQDNVRRARSAIEAQGVRAAQSQETILDTAGRHELRYIPFEHVEVGARLAIIGITPGNNQIQAAYMAWQGAARRGLSDAECLRVAKGAGAFSGSMRTDLIKMMDRFKITAWAGAENAADLWGRQQHLLHCSSVVPHAAYLNGKMFAGTFAQILAAPILRQSFERGFLPELAALSPTAKFIALGPTPMDALDWCVKEGLLAEDRVLGPFCHPSGSSGSQVDVFIGKKTTFDENDPVRYRVEWLTKARVRMDERMAALQ